MAKMFFNLLELIKWFKQATLRRWHSPGMPGPFALLPVTIQWCVFAHPAKDSGTFLTLCRGCGGIGGVTFRTDSSTIKKCNT